MPRKEFTLIRCHNCGHEWAVYMYYDPTINYRGFLDEEVDPFCPVCGHEDKENAEDCVKCEEIARSRLEC